MQPAGQSACLQTDPGFGTTFVLQDAGERVRVAVYLQLVQQPAAMIDDADGANLERHVDAHILFHFRPSCCMSGLPPGSQKIVARASGLASCLRFGTMRPSPKSSLSRQRTQR